MGSCGSELQTVRGQLRIVQLPVRLCVYIDSCWSDSYGCWIPRMLWSHSRKPVHAVNGK